MVTTQACRQFTRQALLAINKRFRCVLDEDTRDVIADLQLRRRGCRAGKHLHVRHRRGPLFTLECSHTTQPGCIPVVNSSRPEVNLALGHRRLTDRHRVLCRPSSTTSTCCCRWRRVRCADIVRAECGSNHQATRYPASCR